MSGADRFVRLFRSSGRAGFHLDGAHPSRRLRERYTIGWLSLATLLLSCGVFPGAIMRLAQVAHLSYPAAVLFVSLGAIYCFRSL